MEEIDRRPEGRTVLVTGGAGFVGRRLAEALDAHNEVRVLDDFSTGSRANVPPDVDVVEGDVRDEETVAAATAGVDIVYHQAGLVSVPESLEAPVASSDVNVGGTVRVLEAARRNDARVVVASSAAVYGDADSSPIPEDAPKNPTSPYGADKLAADNYARVFADAYDLPVVALRYFNVYGCGQNPEYSGVVDAFLRRALTDEPLVVHGDGEQTRDFVHVDDVVRANLVAGVTDATGAAYNVGSGESVSIRRLAELVAELADTDAPIEHGPARPGDIRHSEADIQRAREKLNYEPQTELRVGLGRMIESRRTELPTM
jgi:UDP-glucose 4-epimerase